MASNVPDPSGYEKNYTEQSFMNKATETFKIVGKNVFMNALLLYCAAKAKGTPLTAKAAIVASLGYFISPADVIPDIVPLLGYSDDAAVMAATLATVTSFITPEVKTKAQEIAQRF